MNLPSDTPKMPKWIFLVGDLALVLTAVAIFRTSDHPTSGGALVAIVACVVTAVFVGVIPFFTDYARDQEQAVDNRQRALQALAITISAAAEQVSIAATGLNGIAEAAQENSAKAETLVREIQDKLAALDARLPTAGRIDSDHASRLEAAAHKIAQASSDLEAALLKAAESAQAIAASARSRPQEPAVVASRTEPTPFNPFFEGPPAPPTLERHSRTPSPATAPLPPAESGAPMEPAFVTSLEAVPPSGSAAPRKRAPRRSAPVAAEDPAPVASEVLPAAHEAEAPVRQIPAETPEPEEAFSAPIAQEHAEPAVSADGATRLVVTAYIGIGNRLFIRGDGPGLARDKGAPLTFVSIGKWRWETNEASGPISFRLYKNDEIECTALGERTVSPGAQLELNASF